jgi:hypothetical protein
MRYSMDMTCAMVMRAYMTVCASKRGKEQETVVG